jgi:hypothetical protein
MLCWSWLKWPDVLIDAGWELYTAWQLTAGKTLYVDIACFKGPLSAYLNSLWFRLFGVSLHTLIFCNIMILVVLLCVLYRLLCEVSDRFSATVACLVFVTIFAFGQFVKIGNYNFVFPYSHELTHGVVLSFVAIYCLSVYHRGRGLLPVAAAGFVLGLVFLTKSEVFLAVSVAMATGLGLTIWSERPARGRLRRLLATFAASAIVAPVLAVALFCLAMPLDQALLAMLGSWPVTFSGTLASMVFYQRGLGILDVGASMRALLAWSGWYAALFVPVAGLGLALRRPALYRRGIAAALFVIVTGLLLRYRDTVNWLDAVRPLPLVMLLFGVACVVVLVQRWGNPQVSALSILRLTMIVFAFALLGKMIFHARVYHYGFALAMPATLLLVVALVNWVPSAITKLGGYGGVFRSVALAIFLAGVVAHLRIVGFWLSQKIHPVSTGSDTFLADRRGLFINLALEEIMRNVGVHETLAVVPEGVILNYLARRVNPTPYINVMPADLLVFGEEPMLASFQAHPPDYMALAHRNTREYGFQRFGRDHGQQIFSWIEQHYRKVRLIGAPPLQDDRFGILLLQRTNHEAPH